MRDGVELIADHYMPDTASPSGTLLVRGPYGRGRPSSVTFGEVYAARGYHVVVQSVRGTFGSGGTFEPMVNEAADGADTAAWLREQPWFTGSFATIGLSYLGFTQWALLSDPPQEQSAAVIVAGPHDFATASWATGSFTVNDFLTWSDAVARQEERRGLRTLLRQVRAARLVERAAGEVPMGDSARALLGAGAPWFESWPEHPDPDDPFWARLRHDTALEQAQIPVLLIGGWQDLFLEQTLQQYRRLRERGVQVALTVGPWSHSQMMTRGASTVIRETLSWLDAHLAGSAAPSRSPVRAYVTGGGGWIDLPDWPPATSGHVQYLESGGRLTGSPSGAPATPSEPATTAFTYNPGDPTPTLGGRLLSAGSGYRPDSALADRSDVLAFTGEVLRADLYVFGSPVVEVAHESDNAHVDLFVRVSEVDAKGTSRNVSDGYLRLVHRPGSQRVRIELDEIAHRFRAGSRIRVLIAGGSHPRYARNLGTGEPPLQGRRMVPATHVITHAGASRLWLPGRADLPSAD